MKDTGWVVPVSNIAISLISGNFLNGGDNFGFDPEGTAEQKEAAIAAWENWWAEHAADYDVNP